MNLQLEPYRRPLDLLRSVDPFAECRSEDWPSKVQRLWFHRGRPDDFMRNIISLLSYPCPLNPVGHAARDSCQRTLTESGGPVIQHSPTWQDD